MPETPLPEATKEPPIPMARAEVSSFKKPPAEVATLVTTSGISLYCPNKNIGSNKSIDNRFIILSPQICQCGIVSF